MRSIVVEPNRQVLFAVVVRGSDHNLGLRFLGRMGTSQWELFYYQSMPNSCLRPISSGEVGICTPDGSLSCQKAMNTLEQLSSQATNPILKQGGTVTDNEYWWGLFPSPEGICLTCMKILCLDEVAQVQAERLGFRWLNLADLPNEMESSHIRRWTYEFLLQLADSITF